MADNLTMFRACAERARQNNSFLSIVGVSEYRVAELRNAADDIGRCRTRDERVDKFSVWCNLAVAAINSF